MVTPTRPCNTLYILRLSSIQLRLSENLYISKCCHSTVSYQVERPYAGLINIITCGIDLHEFIWRFVEMGLPGTMKGVSQSVLVLNPNCCLFAVFRTERAFPQSRTLRLYLSVHMVHTQDVSKHVQLKDKGKAFPVHAMTDYWKTRSKKVNFVLGQVMKAQRGRKCIALLLLYPRKRDTVPIVQEAGWTPGPVWTGAENSPPLGFDPWTVQLVASRYTD